MRCAPCHVSGTNEGRPVWTNYFTAFAARNAIRERVYEFEMMPAGNEEFVTNSTGMTLEERELFRDWVDGGALE